MDGGGCVPVRGMNEGEGPVCESPANPVCESLGVLSAGLFESAESQRLFEGKTFQRAP